MLPGEDNSYRRGLGHSRKDTKGAYSGAVQNIVNVVSCQGGGKLKSRQGTPRAGNNEAGHT